MQVSFPLSQEESNKVAVPETTAGKGAKRRQTSVPPDSDTARAKQAKQDADAAGSGGPPGDAAGKGRPRALNRAELNTISSRFMVQIKEKVKDLKPRHYRSLQSLGSDWYKQIYHTKYQATKDKYLDHLHDTAEGDIKMKEPIKSNMAPYLEALRILRRLVANPTIVGLPNPYSSSSQPAQGQKRTASTAAPQAQAKARRDKSAPSSYATAVTGQADGKSQAFGAQAPKSGQTTIPAKSASGP